MILLPFFLFLGSFSFGQKDGTQISIMTFNIRYNNPQDAPNHWENRKDFVGELIAFYNPDFVGTQEVLKDQLNDMQEKLPDYRYVGVARDDGKDAGEFSALFYKKDKYDLLQTATFWLSENPEAIGVMGWDAACNRVVTWGKFKNKDSGLEMFVFNTHFDHKGEIARQESARLILQKVKEIAGEQNAIITGDFNAHPESNVYQTLTRGTGDLPAFHDVYSKAAQTYGPDWTFNSFGKTPVEKRKRIDYIFTNKEARVEKYISISEQRGDVFPSDHLPVLAEISF